jgi:hypothetical protein
MFTMSEDRDLEDRRGQQIASPVTQAASPVPQAPISPEWRTTTRRGAYATMTLALLLGYTWISATRDWGWPLFPSAVLLVAGIYVLLTTYVDRLPAIFGRDHVPIDRSAKYTLWLDSFSSAWSIYEDDPSKFNLRAILTFVNGGSQIIQFKVEQLDLELDGAESVSRTSSATLFRLLPGRGRNIWPPDALGISEGAISGTIRYAITYGSLSGFPSYRRTHAISFASTQTITGDIVTNSVERIALDWSDLEPEEDQDLQ